MDYESLNYKSNKYYIKGSGGTSGFDNQKELLNTSPVNTSQQIFTVFGLYKCLHCGKFELGFNRLKHEINTHAGQKVDWFKANK